VFPLKDNVPTRSFPVVTVGLIVVNAAVWLWEVTGTPVDLDVLRYGFYPCTLQGPCVFPASEVHHLPWFESVFTSMFMHGSWLHIVGNMLFLWIFGNNVEDALGRVRFLLWYLAAGVVAAGLQTAVTLHFSGAAGASIPNIGASGAIAGVLGAYLILLPHAKVLTLFVYVVIPIPAMLFLVFWFFFQIWLGSFSIVHPQSGGGVAFFAHIGGFAFGALTARLIAQREPLRPAW
jgi:rhomboid family protein